MIQVQNCTFFTAKLWCCALNKRVVEGNRLMKYQKQMEMDGSVDVT